ncbi:hypothetical protein FJ656_08435, partial [Schumannella luteola]
MEVLGVLLPLAIGVAFSSVPIMAMIVLLLSPRGQASGLAYLLGYAVGLAGVTVGFTAGLRAIPSEGAAPSPLVIGVAEIVLGVLGVVFAGVSFRRARARRLAATTPPQLPAWLKRVARFGPVPSFVVGIVLNLRPKALVLATAAALALNGGELTPVSWTIDTAIYLVIGLSTVAAPVIVVWRSGE